MMAGNPSDDSNPAASSMKVMNNVMPFMSGFFCLMFPIGMGLYWVAGSVFRILQTIFINNHMKNVDVEDLIKKNEQKRQKKIEKLGYDPAERMQELAKTRTSNIKSSPSSVTNNTSNAANKTSNNQPTRPNVSNVKDGSISGYANMLAGRNSKKEDK